MNSTTADFIDLSAMADRPDGIRPCPIASAIGVMGERWSVVALRELMYGVHRFDQIVAHTGASRDILASRLRKLESAGVVERRQYSERPPRFEYHLTEAGRELEPLLLSLAQWGSRWVTDAPTVEFQHSCGDSAGITHSCKHCGAPVRPENLKLRLLLGE